MCADRIEHAIKLAGAAQTPGETLLGEAMLILKGLDLSVEWELAPEIKNAIHDVCVKYEGHSPAPAPQPHEEPYDDPYTFAPAPQKEKP